MDLQDYYRETADYLVAVRKGGLALSAADDDIVARWFDEGVPLSLLLEAIDNEARRQQTLKRPARNLSMSLVAKQVARTLKKRGFGKQHSGSSSYPELVDSPLAPVRPMLEPTPSDSPMLALLDAVVASAKSASKPSTQQVMAPLLALRDEHAAGLDAYRCRARLVGIANSYLDALVDALLDEQRAAYTDDIKAELGSSLRRMSPRARSETVLELLRRRVAAGDSLFPFEEILP